MTRFKAAGIHLLVCVSVGLLLLAFFWFVWYPAPLFQALGGLEIFLLLLVVDVTLGPLLTLVVFKPSKKSLKFDLATIALVQVGGLIYGIHALYHGRPVYVAALGARFDVVTAQEIDPKELETAQQSYPMFGPKWVGTKQAEEPKERERILFSALGGADYGHFPQHHQPIENMRVTLLKEAESIAALKKQNPGKEATIDLWLAKRGLAPDDVVYQGLKARSKDMAVIMDAKTAKVIGIAPFKPWP